MSVVNIRFDKSNVRITKATSSECLQSKPLFAVVYTLLINFVAGMKGDNVAYGKVRYSARLATPRP